MEETAKRFANKLGKFVTGSDTSTENLTARPQQRSLSRPPARLAGYHQPRHDRRNSLSNATTPVSTGHRITPVEHQVSGATGAQRSAEDHGEICDTTLSSQLYGANACEELPARSRQTKIVHVGERSLPPLPTGSDANARRDQHKDGDSSPSARTDSSRGRSGPYSDRQNPVTTGTPGLRRSHVTRDGPVTLRKVQRIQTSSQQLGNNGQNAGPSHRPHQAVTSVRALWRTMPNLAKAIQQSTYVEKEHVDTASLNPVHTTPGVSQEYRSTTHRKELSRAAGRDPGTDLDKREPGTDLDKNPNTPARGVDGDHGRPAQLDSMNKFHQNQKKVVPAFSTHRTSVVVQRRSSQYETRTGGTTVVEDTDIHGEEGVLAKKSDFKIIKAVDNSPVAAEEGSSCHEMSGDDQEFRVQGELGRHDDDLITIRKLQRQLAEHVHQYEEMKLRWEGAVDALARFRQGSTSALDDVSLKSEYAKITFAVQNWVMTYCSMSIYSTPDVDKLTRTYLRKLTPSWKSYLAKLATRNLLIQSLLMNWLSSEVLTHESHAGLWWAGSRQEALSILMAQLEPAKGDKIPDLLERQDLQLSQVQEYAAWKARTSHMVARSVKVKDVEGHIDAIHAGLERHLALFVPYEHQKKAWDELRSIIQMAITLDEELCKSRAFFTIHGWSDSIIGRDFNEAMMQPAPGSVTPQPGMKVDLVLVPALLKTGSADGDMYERRSFISKWGVICCKAPEPVSNQAARSGFLQQMGWMS